MDSLILDIAATLPRTGFCIVVSVIALTVLSAFRLWLYRERLSSLAELHFSERVRLFWVGFRLDSVIISRAIILLVLLVLVVPDGWLETLRRFFLSYAGIVLFFLFIAEIAGLYFFRYYDFRPNYLVFEHGADPEVLRTIRKAYPVARILLVSSLGAIAASLLIEPWLPYAPKAQAGVLPWFWDRGATFICFLVAGFATRGTLDHRPLNPSFASVTRNRVANEIASCGIFNVLYDWGRQSQKQFGRLKTVINLLPPEEAMHRTRDLLSREGPPTDDSPNPLVRQISALDRARPLNVVLVVMESFTARLVGCLAGRPALSPELDQLADQGVLFERCYATGERTIQGLEAAVSSFPPLPGEGVVKRPQARHGFTTLATILKERGYSTLFLYGGQGIFDDMRAFFIANGFDRFIEEKDFVNPQFRAPWGVSDEDLFDRADQEFRALDDQRRPFFATLLTVSLHSPWEYPSGRIAKLPHDTPVPPGFVYEELNNFLYADYALGGFIRKARAARYFADTLFVFVGDHGVHLRGRDLIPVDEYLVPALFFAPAHLESRRIRAVTSQMDIPPTIMGILGGEYRSPFFGADALRCQDTERQAIVIYNKKRYGIVSEKSLIVLTENGETLNYQRQQTHGPWRSMSPTPQQDEQWKNAVALLGAAENLLISGRYTAARIDNS